MGVADELLAAIYAQPDDDHARAVYADHLLEHGDPRGELIALQLAGTEAARQAALLETHGEAWLGSLRGQVVRESVRWERGFVVKAVPNRGLIDPSDRQWTLMHELGGSWPLSDDHPLPRLRVLSRLHALDIAWLGRLARPLAVEELGWALAPDVERREAEVAFGALTCLPVLRRLVLADRHAQRRSDYVAILRAPWLALEELRANADLAALPEWLPSAPAALTLTETTEYPWSVRLTRAGRHRDLEIIAPLALPSTSWLTRQHRPYGEALFAGLAALPPRTIGLVRVTSPPNARDTTQALLARPLRKLGLAVDWA